MFLFCRKEIVLLFVQLLKSPGKFWNFVESPGNILELWCNKSWKKEKKSSKVLEFEPMFLVGIMSNELISIIVNENHYFLWL